MLAACGGEHLSAKSKWHTRVVSTGRSDDMGAGTDHRAELCQEHSFGQGHGGPSECVKVGAREKPTLWRVEGGARYGTRLRDFRECDRILLRGPGPGVDTGHGRSRFMKGERVISKLHVQDRLQTGMSEYLTRGVRASL